jgi:hypothetical protein
MPDPALTEVEKATGETLEAGRMLQHVMGVNKDEQLSGYVHMEYVDAALAERDALIMRLAGERKDVGDYVRSRLAYSTQRGSVACDFGTTMDAIAVMAALEQPLEVDGQRFTEEEVDERGYVDRLLTRLAAMTAERDEFEAHEMQTHEVLGSILGAHTSLEDAARQIVADLAAAREEARKWETVARDIAKGDLYIGPEEKLQGALARYQPADEETP